MALRLTRLYPQFNKLNHMEISEKEANKLNEIGGSIQNEDWSNESLIQLIELAGSFLNLQTIPDYAKRAGISYNGAKKFRNVKNIFGVKFIIDNF